MNADDKAVCELIISDEGALQGIFKFASFLFPDNDACNDARRGKEDKHYFFEGQELCYKNILPEYFQVSGRGIKRKSYFSADFFQGSVAIRIGIQLSFSGHMIARRILRDLL